jgi:CheY-like chemotaxis protein
MGEKTMKGRILFIDDDKAGREIALFNLRGAGYEVTAASDGVAVNCAAIPGELLESERSLRTGCGAVAG